MKHCLPVTTFSQKTYNIYNTTQYSQTYRAHLYRCSNRIENNKITSNFREETIFDSKSLFVYTGGKAIFAANKDFYRKSWNQFHVIQKHRLKEARDVNATMLLHYISLGGFKIRDTLCVKVDILQFILPFERAIQKDRNI